MDSQLLKDARTIALRPRSERLAIAVTIAASTDTAAINALAEAMTCAPGANDLFRDWFDEVLNVFVTILREKPRMFETEMLVRLRTLQDIGEDFSYYSMDPHYDAGHDFRYADFSRVRELAAEELDRRGSPRT